MMPRMMTPSSFRRVRAAVLLTALALTLPATVGGCPGDLRNSVLDSVQGAVETVVVNAGDPAAAGVTALRDIAGAVIDQIFSRFRASATSSST
jgi:hypothetical protein